MLRLTPLTPDTVEQIIAEAMSLLGEMGVRIGHVPTRTILADAGARVDVESGVVYMPEQLIWQSLGTVPFGFSLYDLKDRPAVEFGGDHLQFAPGSSGVTILSAAGGDQRPSETSDLLRFYPLVEMMPAYEAHSIPFVCHDIPAKLQDVYGVYTALRSICKPLVISGLGHRNIQAVIELLTIAAGGESELRAHPSAICEIPCTPALLWTETACRNMIECARAGVPLQLTSTPLAGMSAPITLAAAAVQHAAEILSGIAIVQAVQRGAPVVWGCSASVTDMRTGVMPAADVSAWLINSAGVQVAKSLGLPTQTRMMASDSKQVDYQAGLDASGGGWLAALSGANLISGAGMLDYLRCFSFEKLILDAEVIAMSRRLSQGIEIRDIPIARYLLRLAGHGAYFLGNSHTAEWYSTEVNLPGPAIDRGSLDAWLRTGSQDAFQRATAQIDSFVNGEFVSPLSNEKGAALKQYLEMFGERQGIRLVLG